MKKSNEEKITQTKQILDGRQYESQDLLEQVNGKLQKASLEKQKRQGRDENTQLSNEKSQQGNFMLLQKEGQTNKPNVQQQIIKKISQNILNSQQLKYSFYHLYAYPQHYIKKMLQAINQNPELQIRIKQSQTLKFPFENQHAQQKTLQLNSSVLKQFLIPLLNLMQKVRTSNLTIRTGYKDRYAIRNENNYSPEILKIMFNTRFQSLKQLSLVSLGLDNIQFMEFIDHTNLKKLDLSYNFIRTINPLIKMRNKNKTQSQDINFSNNKINQLNCVSRICLNKNSQFIDSIRIGFYDQQFISSYNIICQGYINPIIKMQVIDSTTKNNKILQFYQDHCQIGQKTYKMIKMNKRMLPILQQLYDLSQM